MCEDANKETKCLRPLSGMEWKGLSAGWNLFPSGRNFQIFMPSLCHRRFQPIPAKVGVDPGVDSADSDSGSRFRRSRSPILHKRADVTRLSCHKCHDNCHDICLMVFTLHSCLHGGNK